VILLNGERFSLASGALEAFERTLDLRAGLLTRRVRWTSPSGLRATLQFQRIASLAEPHHLLIRCQVTPEFDGKVEFRAALQDMDNQGLAHWEWLGQGKVGDTVFLHSHRSSPSSRWDAFSRSPRLAKPSSGILGCGSPSYPLIGDAGRGGKDPGGG
jgi:kojibiose phosphorylase